MRKNGILIGSMIAVLLFANIIYAEDGNTLDAVKVAIQIMENDSSLKAAAEASANAMEKFGNAKKSPDYTNLISSEYQANISQRALAVKENAIRLEAYQQYINILKAKNALEVQRIALNQTEQAYKDMQLRAKLGIASEDELEAGEGQYMIEKLQLQIKERDLQTLLSTLNVLMGQEPRNDYSAFLDSNMVLSEEIETLEAYMASAMNNRAEILDIQEQLLIQETEKKFAVYKYQDLKDPIYTQFEYEIENLKSEMETNIVEIQIELQSKYDELTNSMKSLKDAQSAMEEAEEHLKLMELKSDMGILSETAKKAEELTYIKAKYNLKNAQLNAWLIQEQMNCVSGVGF